MRAIFFSIGNFIKPSSLFTILLIFIFESAIYAQFDSYNKISNPNSLRVNKLELTKDNQIFICSFTKGIFHSKDNGETWENFGPFNESINGLKVDSYGNYYMFITAYTYGGEDQPGVFKSVDNGLSWKRIVKGITHPYVRDLLINKNDSVFISVQGGGVFYFNDSAEVWINIGLTGESVRSMNIDSKGRLYASIDGYGLYRKNNILEDWVKIDGIWFSMCPEIFLTEKDVIYLATGSYNNLFGQGIYKSTDYGETWKEINNGLSNYDIRTICTYDDNIIYAGASDGQVYKSFNSGDSWIQLELYHTNTATTSLRRMNNGNILYSSWGGGIYRFDETSNKWKEFGPKLNINVWNFDIKDNKLFCITAGGIYESEDFGVNWFGINNKLLEFDLKEFVITDNDNILISTWGDGLYYSEDFGKTWVKHNDIPANAAITFLKKSPVTGSIFVGMIYYEHGVYKSDDNGKSFTKIKNFEQPETMFISDKGDLLICTWDIHYSNNDGNNWEIIYNSNYHFSAISMDSQSKIYAGTLDGFFLTSNNKGESWTEKYYPGFTFTNLNIFDDSVVVASTNDNKNYIYEENEFKKISSDWLTNCNIYSVKKNEDKTLVCTSKGLYIKSESPSNLNTEKGSYDFSLKNAYPNPFNPTSTINYTIKKIGNVNITIYDALGRNVKELVNEIKTPGSYEIKFDGTNLASGVYFYTMKVNNFFESKKIILAK